MGARAGRLSMAEMGNGYGSECHLLRYLGRHRGLFNQRVLSCVGGTKIEWLDFKFDPKNTWPDAELAGMDFLSDGAPAKDAWRNFWPQTGRPPNWDAVGRITVEGNEEWLLVEAKANLAEIKSDCMASRDGGLGKIIDALNDTKKALGVASDRDWLSGYYQFCNRLAVLRFLTSEGVASRLLFIYFCGDRGDAQRVCPEDETGWAEALDAQSTHVGLPDDHLLSQRIHKLFLPVCFG